MADYKIFREQLATKYPSYGYALWQPSPTNPNRPVQVGDVGFIREGRFYRLFNALLSADDPDQERRVPEYHEPLVPTLSDHVATVPLGRNNYCSAGVKAEADPGYRSSPDDLPQVLFQNETTRAAAVLSLPVTTRREDTLIKNVFGQWMVRHIDTWFAFAKDLGLVNQMEEIILVTGCDLTKSWTNVAFLGGADAQVSFGVKVEGPNTSINFQFSPEHAHGALLHHGPEGPNLPENQCVFIRGFRVAPSLWSLRKRLKAAAGPSPDPGGYDCDQDKEVISIPEIAQFCDPLHLLSDFIAEQASDCDKILVHDDDLLMIDEIGHGSLLETLEPDVMVDLFKKSDIKIHKFGCDSFLAESQSGPNNDTSDVKVATVSMTFQDWNPTPPSQWPPLAPQKTDISHTSELPGTPRLRNFLVPTFQRVSTKHKLSLPPERDDSPPSTLQDYYDWPPLATQKIDFSHANELLGTPLPVNLSVPTSQRVSIKRKPSLPPEHDNTPTTSQDYCNYIPPGKSARQQVSSGTGDPSDSSSYMTVHNNGSSSGHGSKQWPCKICTRDFDRQQELERHIQLVHLPCWVYCPYSSCQWRGCRVDDLQKHLDQQKCNKNSTEQEHQIYDVKTILEMIKDAETIDTIRKAQDWAVDLVRERARELGKHEWLVDPWGCLEQRERRISKS